MFVSHINLKNWRNFLKADVDLHERMFLVGPNASGKSNFIDVFRFLRDIAKPNGGGLQQAVQDRGGISKIRCLSTRRAPDIAIEVYLSDEQGKEPLWKYAIGIKQESRGARLPLLAYEKVWRGSDLKLDRPDENDKKDKMRLTQTHLEQINTNEEFRDIAKYFQSVAYLHLVPQILRHPDLFSHKNGGEDPFGGKFLDQIANTTEKTRKARLKKIEKALRTAVPQLKQLTDVRDNKGTTHLEAVYEHWRPNAGKQREDQFSDGTLRLIGLLWSLLDSDTLLLLEEPELSLNSGIVSKLPSLMFRLLREKKRQVLITTHSTDLLSDKGIGGEEILLLTPSSEGTAISPATSDDGIRKLLESGFSIAEAVMPHTEPKEIAQLELFQ